MFKHLKPFQLFEKVQSDEDLLDIKDIVQDLVDEWDIYWVDEVDWSDLMSSLYKNEDYFVFNVRRLEGNKDWQILVDFILPQNKDHKVWKNIKKFRNDLDLFRDRLIQFGFEKSMIFVEGLHYQIAINNI